jgi:hypothetical protein
MPSFKVWRDNGEQWDATDADSPNAIIQAANAVVAAELFAERKNEGMDHRMCVIVQDEAGIFYEIELVHQWTLSRKSTTTLEELCSG